MKKNAPIAHTVARPKSATATSARKNALAAMEIVLSATWIVETETTLRDCNPKETGITSLFIYFRKLNGLT